MKNFDDLCVGEKYRIQLKEGPILIGLYLEIYNGTAFGFWDSERKKIIHESLVYDVLPWEHNLNV